MDSTVQFHPFLCHTKNSRTLETLIEMCHLIFMQCPGVLFYLLLTRSCFDFFTILYLFEFFELNWAVLYWKFFIESQLRCHNIGVPLNRIPYSWTLTYSFERSYSKNLLSLRHAESMGASQPHGRSSAWLGLELRTIRPWPSALAMGLSRCPYRFKGHCRLLYFSSLL